MAAADWGVWVEKSMYGRKYMGMERATFLVDAKGVIAEAWHKVKVPGHVEAVLAAANKLVKLNRAVRAAVNRKVLFLAARLDRQRLRPGSYARRAIRR